MINALSETSESIVGMDGQFTEVPSSLNLTYGETAMFVCRHQSADHISWEVTPRWRYDQFEPTTVGGMYVLSVLLRDGINYNATIIQCKALFDDHLTQSTEPAILLVQEPLDPVDDLRENETTSTLSWTSPPSLDLTNANPDVAYCVDVYNITCGMRDHIDSVCNVTEPSYTRRIGKDGNIYEHVVTPRSNVPEASNGTSRSLKDDYHALNISGADNLTDFRDLHFHAALNQLHPSSYTMILESIDHDVHTDREIQINITAIVDTNNNTIYFNLSSVPLKRLFACEIRAYGCMDNRSLLATFKLSTHNIQNISVIATSDGIQIEGHYTDNSGARELLVIMYNMHDPVPQYYLIPRHEGSPKRRKLHYRLNVDAGEWSVSIFVVENNQLPFSHVATPPVTVFIPNSSSEVPPQPIEYSVQNTSECVLITCHFERHTLARDCLVVVHQQLTQINLTSGLMSIEANHTQRITRHDDTASVCVPGLDLGVYQIGVANGREVPVRSRSAPQVHIHVVIAILGFTVLVLTVLLPTIITIVWLRKRKRRIEISGDQAVSKKLLHVPTKQAMNRDRYVELPRTTNEGSNTKQEDMDTYTSKAFDGDNSTSIKEEASTTPLNRVDHMLCAVQCHDSSGIVSQPSDSENSECDDAPSLFGDPAEVVDQRVKTVDDLDASIVMAPENANLIPPAVQGFPILYEEPHLPQSKESSHEDLQPVTAQPLPYNQGGDEVALPGQHRTNILKTLSKDQVKKSEIDADDNELVTGIDKPEKTEYDSQ